MIIFYSKQTGEIVGTIDGRIHTEEQLNMWIGDKNETERVIINWKPKRFLDENDNEITEAKFKQLRGKKKGIRAVWEPEHENPLLIKDLETHKVNLGKFKIIKGKFEKKSKEEIDNKKKSMETLQKSQEDRATLVIDIKAKIKDKDISVEERLDAVATLLDMTSR